MYCTGHNVQSSHESLKAVAGPAVGLAVVVLSAGGLPALRQLLGGLRPPLPGAMIIAQHVLDGTVLPELIECWTPHRVITAATGLSLREGSIYVCPAQRHLIVNPDGRLNLSAKPHVRFVRPSFDWLLESTAASYRERATAVLLAGANQDGARGARAIAANGGSVIVQDPQTCSSRELPSAALETGAVHWCLAPGEMALVVADRLHTAKARWADSWEEPFASDAPSLPLSAAASAGQAS